MTLNTSDGPFEHRVGSFTNAQALASPEWLLERLDDTSVKVIDTRYIVEQDDRGRFREIPGKESYLESHIPGAVFLSLDDLRDAGEPAHIVDPGVFGETMSMLGVGNDDEVVVYDTEGGVWCARLWWALRLHGHDNVRILDGGFTTWGAEGLPVESGDRIVRPAAFVPGISDGLVARIDDVVAAMGDEDTVIVDGLTEPFHTGRMRLYAPLPAGHIPGAINVPAPDNLDPETDRLLPAGILAVRWETVIGSADRIITYCGGGMYGAFDLFVLHLLGYDAALYDGSWEEWAATEHLPIATVPPGLPDERI